MRWIQATTTGNERLRGVSGGLGLGLFAAVHSRHVSVGQEMTNAGLVSLPRGRNFPERESGSPFAQELRIHDGYKSDIIKNRRLVSGFVIGNYFDVDVLSNSRSKSAACLVGFEVQDEECRMDFL
jgi:hypothetical protein